MAPACPTPRARHYLPLFPGRAVLQTREGVSLGSSGDRHEAKEAPDLHRRWADLGHGGECLARHAGTYQPFETSTRRAGPRRGSVDAWTEAAPSRGLTTTQRPVAPGLEPLVRQVKIEKQPDRPPSPMPVAPGELGRWKVADPLSGRVQCLDRHVSTSDIMLLCPSPGVR